MLGDLFQSVLGFAGTTQWAAGLHVLWLILAAGLTRKAGAGTITGILKGAVELLTGNTHGILILLVDVAAGLLVDLGLLPFRNRDSLPAYALAGGLGSASNVFVFQLFAALPADLLSYGAMLLIGLVAFASGIFFAGVLGYSLLNSLRRSGVVKDQGVQSPDRRITLGLAAAGIVVVGLLGAYLRTTLQGPSAIAIHGAVNNPYQFPSRDLPLDLEIREIESEGIARRYEGFPLRAVLTFAEPMGNTDTILIQASDGYGFFLTLEELETNDGLLLVPHSDGEDTAYDIVGATSKKAWVRNVTEIVFVEQSGVPFTGALDSPSTFYPADWQAEMDSAAVNLASGPKKLQGVLLRDILFAMQPGSAAQTVTMINPNTSIDFSLEEILADDELRVFTLIGPESVSFVLARMNGDVLLEGITAVDVK